MSAIATMEDLRTAIRDLEDQDYVNEQFMRRRVEKIVDDLKPINLVKNMFRQVVKTPETKTTLLGLISGNSVFRIAAGLATSFVVKKFFKKGAYAVFSRIVSGLGNPWASYRTA
jgi:hypothetical protein